MSFTMVYDVDNFFQFLDDTKNQNFERQKTKILKPKKCFFVKIRLKIIFFDAKFVFFVIYYLLIYKQFL